MKEYIYISAFGYIKRERASDIDCAGNGLLLISSTAKSTHLLVGEQRIWLKKYHTCVYRCTEIEGIELLSGQAMFVALDGYMTEKDIPEEKLGSVLSFSANETLASRIRQLQAALDYDKKLDEKKLTELGFGVLLDIWTHEIAEKCMPKVVSHAIAIIDEDFGRLYGIDDLADRIGVSKSHLIRQFQASMKTTPGMHLEKTRIDKAKVLLVSVDLDLQMVANLCGYSCANYFSKVFKKRVGICPSEYREKGLTIGDVQVPDELYL